eukprot:scaffold4641_cov74-Skeletonema_dohrnii-CCMP3373.AAC.1
MIIEASIMIEGYMPLLMLVIRVTAMLGMAASNSLAPYRILRCAWCNEVRPAVHASAQLNFLHQIEKGPYNTCKGTRIHNNFIRIHILYDKEGDDTYT